MQIQPKQPTVKAPAETFTGDAWYDVIVRGDEPSRIRASVVRFAPGARNAWHAHAMGQTVHVIDGIGRMQARGGALIEIRPGDTIQTPPREWHWHGAGPDHFHDPLHGLRGSRRRTRDGVGRAGERRGIPRRARQAIAMSGWTSDELARIGHATELHMASSRPDGSLRRSITIWVVRAGDEIYVRSAYGWDNGWFQHALRSGEGRIRAGGVERDVTFELADSEATSEVSAAYHAKYDRYGAAMVGTVVSPEAERSTLRITPC